MVEPKKLDLSQNSFFADGTEYFISRGMTVARFMEFEKLQAHVGFGVDFKTLYSELIRVYDFLDKNKQNEPRVILHNLLNGIKEKIDNRLHPALQLCTLFINEKGEDLSDWNEEQATIKITKWN